MPCSLNYLLAKSLEAGLMLPVRTLLDKYTFVHTYIQKSPHPYVFSKSGLLKIHPNLFHMCATSLSEYILDTIDILLKYEIVKKKLLVSKNSLPIIF